MRLRPGICGARCGGGFSKRDTEGVDGFPINLVLIFCNPSLQ